MTKVIRVVGALLALMLAAAILLPWTLYWAGLHNISGRPIPSASPLTPADSANLQGYLRNNSPIFVKRLSPWTYFPSYVLADPRPMPGADIAWIIARQYNYTHLHDRHMIWWHISGAALTVWLTRNWTAEQVLVTAAAVLRGRAASNNRFERSQGRVFGKPRRGSMIGIKCLRLTPTQSRVAQPHR
jgi:hypothetical protein